MTASKKTMNKNSKSPTPATKVTKAPARKKSAAAVATTSAPTLAPVAPAPAAAKLPAVRPVASTPVQTKIIARIDVGFGNALYVRGDGPGLSWNEGVRMECVGADEWQLMLGESSRPVSFKLLLNDNNWCTGPDSTVASGSLVTVTPEFP